MFIGVNKCAHTVTHNEKNYISMIELKEQVLVPFYNNKWGLFRK